MTPICSAKVIDLTQTSVAGLHARIKRRHTSAAKQPDQANVATDQTACDLERISFILSISCSGIHRDCERMPCTIVRIHEHCYYLGTEAFQEAPRIPGLYAIADTASGGLFHIVPRLAF